MANTNVPTPHIEALEGEIAETILLPGDPLRAKFIADNFLTDVKQFNSTRNMLGFTGFYNGKRVSVMGTGMGCPSIGIYSYELIHFYGVKNLIRVGTAGALSPRCKVRDMVIGMGACTTSNYVRLLHRQLRAFGEGCGCGEGTGDHVPCGQRLKLRHVLRAGQAGDRRHDMVGYGRPGRGNGGGGSLQQRGGGGSQRAVHLHDLGFRDHRRGDDGGGAAEDVYEYDEGGAGAGVKPLTQDGIGRI